MFGITRLEAELAGLLIAVAAVLLWLGFHDATIKRDAVAPVLAQVQAAADAASTAAAIKYTRVIAEQAGNLHEAQSTQAAQAADLVSARGAVAVAYRLRDDALHRAAAAAHPAASDPGAAGDLVPGTDMVPWSMYASAVGARAEAESDAADLAAFVACLRTSGGLCAADYDAVAALKP